VRRNVAHALLRLAVLSFLGPLIRQSAVTKGIAGEKESSGRAVFFCAARATPPCLP
jgi:hypothetical protein